MQENALIQTRRLLSAAVPFLPVGTAKDCIMNVCLGLPALEIMRAFTDADEFKWIRSVSGIKYGLLNTSGLVIFVNNLGISKSVIEITIRELLRINVGVMAPHILIHECDTTKDHIATIVNSEGLVALAVQTPHVTCGDNNEMGFTNTLGNWKWVTSYTLNLTDQHMMSDIYIQ